MACSDAFVVAAGGHAADVATLAPNSSAAAQALAMFFKQLLLREWLRDRMMDPGDPSKQACTGIVPSNA
jgi:hypothetical protein